MTKRFRIFLEYIPLIIILVYTFFLFKATADDGILLVWKNYIGFIFLAATITLFFVRHLFGVLALGLTLVLGFLGILSYSPGIWTMSIRLGDGAIAADGNTPYLLFSPNLEDPSLLIEAVIR